MTTDPDPSDEQHPEQDSPVITNLRKERDAGLAEAQAARRELALHKAGLGDLSPKQMRALEAAHDGDWESEALKATATELNFVREPANDQAAQEPQIPAEELAAHRRVAQAQNGEPPATQDEAALVEAMKNASTEKELDQIIRNAGMYNSQG